VPVFICGRSLCIVDWRMVVVVGRECPTACENGAGIVRVRGKCLGNMSEGAMSYTLCGFVIIICSKQWLLTSEYWSNMP